MNKELLSVCNMFKRYDEFQLDNISLSIHEGDIVGFIGKNGAGKTTLIQCIMGIVEADSGKVKVLNEVLENHNYKVKNNIGVAFDTSCFPEEMTPISIDKTMKRIYKNWDSPYFLELLNKFSLPKNKKIKNFSSGMKMLLSFITSMSHKARVLIYDEATNGLDPEKKLDVLTLMKEYVDKYKAAIFISSHMLNDLDKICTSFVFINNGKLVLQASKKELLNKYKSIVVTKSDYQGVNTESILGHFFTLDGQLKVIVEKEKYLGDVEMNNTSIEEIALSVIKGEVVC